MAKKEVKVKVAPNSKESEMMVLGCMLTSVNSLNVGADQLHELDFYYVEHQTIFHALQAAYKQDKPADIHIISEELKKQNKLDEIGGVSYLTILAQYAGTSAFIEEYVGLVREKAILRQMIQAAEVIERAALEETKDVSSLLDDAQAKFYQISQSASTGSQITIKDLLAGFQSESGLPFLKELQERQEKFLEKGPDQLKITGIPTHFRDLDKIVNGFSPSNFMILAARPAMGKCVTGDTQILNPKTGALVQIQELVKQKNGTVVTLGKDWKLNATAPIAYVADGVKPTFKLTTALGREIEATAVHPLLTIQGWKRLEELKIDDRIAVPRELPYFGNQEWPEHKLKVLAYLIADGSLTKGQPGFTNTNANIVQDFKQAAYAFGPIKIRCENMDRNAPTYYIALDKASIHQSKTIFSKSLQQLSIKSKKSISQIINKFQLCPALAYQWANGGCIPSYEVSAALAEEVPELPSLVNLVRDNPVTAFLKELGLMNKNSHHKFFPQEIFQLKKENIALFINRLFSCDGTAYLANCGGNPFPVIAYASVSKTIIYQLQHLLLRFSILAKVRKKSTKCNGKSCPSFELEIHGKDNITKFCKEIGIFGKEPAVEKVLKHVLSIPDGWTKDTLPIEIWDLILQKKGDRSWGSLFRAKNLPEPSNLHAKKRHPRRDTVARIANVLDDEELLQLSSADVYWDRITSITPTGEKEVFDLTIADTHNFIAGDIIVHNTALALNLAENICFKNNVPVGIFSLEMSAVQLLHRIICSQSEIESEKILTGSLNGNEFQKIVASINRMQKHTMVIDDQPGLKITDLRSRARRMKETHKIGFLVIDYLQLISGSGTMRSQENRQIEISEISRLLKTLARELNIPILCLSQLSRKVEERQGHRPMMSDLRESGSLEQDSDLVMFLLRKEYYDPYDKPGMAELIIAKNRHGAIGNVELVFRKEFAQFRDFIQVKTDKEAFDNKAAFDAFSPKS